MGCEQSTPVEGKQSQTTNLGGSNSSKSKSKEYRMTVGGTERLLSSKARKEKPSTAQEQDKVPPKLTSEGQLMPEEIVKRTTSCPENIIVKVGSPGKGNVIKIQYAYWTQQGWYPDNPHKANQDAFSISHKFAGEPGDIMFGVYDGHGDEGHTCAAYTRKHLPSTMEKYIRKKRVSRYQASLKAKGETVKGSYNPRLWPKLSVKDYEDVCRKSFVECNGKMHQDDNVRDKLSGTTAITASFHFGRLTVCNVGDSRVVLGHRIDDGNNGDDYEEEKLEIGEEPSTPEQTRHQQQQYGGAGRGQLVAIPLSQDQTPYRSDERARVKKCGAAVMSIDQMEGLEPMHENWGSLNLGVDIDIKGDPPRVWAKGESYPGCAFTRSMGDSIADNIGVIAEPEMLTKELTRNDEILVIATDGIFEFLTNQGVVDMCAECETALEACERLVKASYSQWLHYEDRTDDITVIVCFLKSDAAANAQDAKGTTKDLVKAREAKNNGATIDGSSPTMALKGPRPKGKSMRAERSNSLFEPDGDAKNALLSLEDASEELGISQSVSA